MQKWKIDSRLHSCERINGKKVLDYHTTYVQEFLNSDPIRDWESIDRCKWLWDWSMKRIGDKEGVLSDFIESEATTWRVLDIGTKDGQFPEWLKQIKIREVIGIEISEDYVSYAQEKGRPVIYGDVCNLPDEWTNKYNYVFAHHVLGLTPDYQKSLEEMYRVTSPDGYMIALNQVPGNEKKHFSYIADGLIFEKFINNHLCKVLYNGYLNTGFANEWVIFIQKEKKRKILKAVKKPDSFTKEEAKEAVMTVIKEAKKKIQIQE